MISVPLGDLFATEVIGVPSRGSDRWLTQRIATAFAERGFGDGVAANIEFPLPHKFVSRLLAQLPDSRESQEAWTRQAAIAQLEQIIEDHRNEDWMWLITRFVHGLDGDRPGPQRLRAAQKIERLLSSYSRYRPEMVEQWTAGRDIGPDGRPIRDAAAWQPPMWRLLRDSIGVPPLHEVLPDVLHEMRSGAPLDDMPERLSLYGVTRIDPVDLAVLDAFADVIDVHVFVLHPSHVLWDDNAEVVDLTQGAGEMPARDPDPVGDLGKHPLLHSWGQESRELQLVMSTRPGWVETSARSFDGNADTLLARLQRDVRANREASPVTIEDLDRTIQIHACHGAQRQAEALRDAILHLLSDDPTLEPRDIVIMTPDLESFAPLIDAAFSATRSDGGGLPDLRVRIADRALTRTNPLIRLATHVVELSTSRFGTEAVAQFLALPEVQRSLGVSTDAAAEMAALMDDTNIRWGLDKEHRAAEGAGPRDEHAWNRGLDRAVAGVFYRDSRTFTVNDVAPLSQIEGQYASVAGALATLIERLRAVRELLQEPCPRSTWATRIATSVRLIASTRRTDEWQWGQLDRILERTFLPAQPDSPDPDTTVDEAALLVAPWGKDRPSNLHHHTGDITVCTMTPMRSVPYRVVCVVGMEHDRFPRSSRNDGEDLLLDHELIGDPDRGMEDRQILLDALLAAGDHFLFAYTGHDPRNGTKKTPAVQVSELLETVAAMVGEQRAVATVTEHPLQPFSPRNFTSGELGVTGPWGFDPNHCAGAVALTGSGTEDEIREISVSVDGSEEPLTLDGVIRYLKHPSNTFLRRSLGIAIPEMGDPRNEDLPTGLSALERWGLEDRMLDGLQRGDDPEELWAHERAADSVPAGDIATEHLEGALELARQIEEAARDNGCETDLIIPVAGTVTVNGEELAGSVLASVESALVCDVGPSKAKPDRITRLYARVAFLSALDPARPWRGVLVGKDDDSGVIAIDVGPLGDSEGQRLREGQQRLAALVALYRTGMSTPITLFTRASYAWAANVEGEREEAVRKAWEPNWEGRFGEGLESAHQLLFPYLTEVDELMASEFKDYAEQLWDPILEVTEGPPT